MREGLDVDEGVVVGADEVELQAKRRHQAAGGHVRLDPEESGERNAVLSPARPLWGRGGREQTWSGAVSQQIPWLL